MHKDGYEFLNVLECVDDQLIYQASQPWDGSKKNEKSGHGIKAACTAMVIILGLGGTFHRQVEAAISSFTTRIAQVLGVKNDLASYAEVVNSSQTKEGITVTLNEVILAGQELLVSFEVTPEAVSDIENIGAALNDRVKINGTVSENESNIFHDFMEGDTSHRYVETFTFKEGTVTEEEMEIQVGLNIYRYKDNQIGRKAQDAEEISFAFSFTASCSDMEKEYIDIPISRTLQGIDDSVMELTWFSMNPISSTISVKSEDSFDASEYYLKGTDSEGNELLYFMRCVIVEREEFDGLHYVFENEWGDTLPSLDCRWVELQLYHLDLPDTEEGFSLVEGETPEGGISSYTVEHMDGEIEKLENQITIGMDEMKPVGEKFRIEIPE